MRAILVLAAIGTLCAGARVGYAQRGAADENLPRIWTGVYTAEQAEQGKAPFTGLCRRCHELQFGVRYSECVAVT